MSIAGSDKSGPVDEPIEGSASKEFIPGSPKASDVSIAGIDESIVGSDDSIDGKVASDSCAGWLGSSGGRYELACCIGSVGTGFTGVGCVGGGPSAEGSDSSDAPCVRAGSWFVSNERLFGSCT